MNPKQDPFLAALMGADARPVGGLIAATVRPPAPKTPPHYYRCKECLTTYTTEKRLPECSYKTAQAVCDCGCERSEYLGQSSRPNRLVRQATLCACDARCTYATGPNCDCSCLGANHGTGRTITVDYDGGPIPKLKQQRPDEAKAIRKQFQEATAAAYDRIRAKFGPSLVDRIEAGAWVDDREAWNGVRWAKQAVLEARALKTHKGRLAKLAAVAAL